MKIKPLYSTAFIRLLDKKNRKTASGLHIPDTADEDRGAARFGHVVCIGVGEWEYGHFTETTVKEGDLVVFGPAIGTRCVINDETLLAVSEGDILAVLEE